MAEYIVVEAHNAGELQAAIRQHAAKDFQPILLTSAAMPPMQLSGGQSKPFIVLTAVLEKK